MTTRPIGARLGRLRPSPRQWRTVVAFLGCAFLAALVALPISVVRGVEQAHFTDRLGTFPVSVGLCHDGSSTLDTGILGKVYLHRTGPFGFGAYARSIGPPEAGGSLASYVDPTFIRANVALINDPDEVIRAYSRELSSSLRQSVLHDELVAAILGGSLIFVLVPRTRLRGVSRRRLIGVSTALIGLGLGASVGTATRLFQDWPCSSPPKQGYSVAGLKELSFSSPEVREVAAQVKPFIEKNTVRLKDRSAEYEQDTKASFAKALAKAELAPRPGEKIVIAEADPQGSYVGVDVRTEMYRALVRKVGRTAFALRTISGDVTSNGTVTEQAYVAAEAKVSGDIPTVAVAGDHDSVRTWKQMSDRGITVPDLKVKEVDGIRVAAANDREHKTLFGGMITDTAGISEAQLGERLRKVVGDPTRGTLVLLHQPDAAAGYLGVENMGVVRALEDHLTTPYDDGIPDQAPGVLSIGHLHRAAGPWVLWNTDGDKITWTVVDQLGTAGGVENAPTFSRFSTPISVPLKPVMVRLQYLKHSSGLETGYVTIICDLSGRCTISPRVDVGLAGGEPLPTKELFPDGAPPSGAAARPSGAATATTSDAP